MAIKKLVTIYQYPKCSTCKNALKYLDANGVDYRKINISEQPPNKTELRKMLKSYGGDMRKLFNTSGLQYRALKLSDQIDTMGEGEAIDLLSQNGKLVKRPFLLTDTEGVVGFKKDEWNNLLF